MLRLALILSALAFPASAQSAGECIGLVDGLAWLHVNGFNLQSRGLIDGGTLSIYEDAEGTFLVVVMDDAEACIAARGVGWALMPDA